MLKQRAARKVTVHVADDVKHHGEPLYVAVLNYLFYRGVAGATVTKGVAGFGANHQMHSARILELSGSLPATIEFIEEEERLGDILPKLVEMVAPAVVEVQDTTVLTAPRESEGHAQQRAPLAGTAKLMRIFIGESDRWGDKPLYDALVESLRANDIAGVTVYRGIAGYGAHRRFHKEKRLSLSRDLPVILSVVDQESRLRAYLPLLEEMVQEGLVVLSDVDVIKSSDHIQHDRGEPS